MIRRTIVSGNVGNRLLWLLSVSLVLTAVLPSAGAVLRSAVPSLIAVEVCSVLGSRVIQVAAADLLPASAPVTHDGTSHCPLCFLPGRTSALPPPAGDLFIATAEAIGTVLFLSKNHYFSAVPAGNTRSRAPPTLV